MKKILLALAAILFSAALYAAKPVTFNVATYNIRMPAQSDVEAGNGWQRRCQVVAQLAYTSDFDIFGTQEATKPQIDDMLANLPGYKYIGVAREDGKELGEHSAIFYNADMFDVLDQGNFWLAEDTTYPHLGWDAACIRICTWGKFRHKQSGRKFIFMNLHMDHVGKVARTESAKLVKAKIEEIGSGLPAFVTGDFNVDQTSEAYATITGDKRLLDAFEVSEYVFAPNGTFNAWHPDGFTTQRIDHIFVTPDVKVLKYSVLTDTYRTIDGNEGAMNIKDAPEIMHVNQAVVRTPSDHFPVRAKIVLQ